MSIAIKKITILDTNEKEFFVYTRYEEKKGLSIHIVNIEEAEAYSGEVTEFDLRYMAVEIPMTYKAYLEDTLSAFTFENPKNLNFTYCLEPNDELYKFIWKKSLDYEAVTLRLGYVLMTKRNHISAISNMLSVASVALLNLNIKVKELNAAQEESERIKSESLDVLNDALRVKEDLEKEMYSKFLLVLNNKKRKITELKETIDSLQSSVNGVVPRKIKVEVDDQQGVNDVNKPGPSGMTKRSLTSSLLLSDDSEEVDCPVKPSKQRVRKVARNHSKSSTNRIDSKANFQEPPSTVKKTAELKFEIENTADLVDFL